MTTPLTPYEKALKDELARYYSWTGEGVNRPEAHEARKACNAWMDESHRIRGGFFTAEQRQELRNRRDRKLYVALTTLQA